MRSYLLKRLFLIPLTLFGVSCLVFCLTRLIPGGPIEQLLQQQAMAALDGEGAGQSSGTGNLNLAERERLNEMFNLHEPTWRAYLQWLGAMPKQASITRASMADDQRAYLSLQAAEDAADEKNAGGQSEGAAALRVVELQRSGNQLRGLHLEDLQAQGWHFDLLSPEAQQQRAMRYSPDEPPALSDFPHWQVRAYQLRYDGLLQGSLGMSYKYNIPVWDMIAERLPVTLYLGILGALISYGVSLPLGVLKAVYHKSLFDQLSSFFIFVAYAIPGFALGAILLVYLGARLEWFPIYGLTSEGFEHMTWWEQLKDLAWHTALPLCCYVISTFAMTTMMMKNNLMENLSADYMRTAVAKGCGFHRAVWHHALRNSIIPIASTLGSVLGVVIGGSVLIERIFDIQGFGLLSYQALLDKDYSLIMGSLLLCSAFIVVGNLLADICVALIDRRIRF